MKKMHAPMKQAMTQMQQQIQSMPPDQRKRIEAMMEQQGRANARRTRPRLREGRRRRKVGTWGCTPIRIAGVNQPERHEEFCLVRINEVGLNRDDVKVFGRARKFMQEIAPAGRATQAFDFDA